MAKAKFNPQWGSAAEAGKAQAAQQQQTLEHDRKERKGAMESSIPLSRIKSRHNGDTRKLDPMHIIELAESIDAVGLVEPLVTDRRGFLLAGGHRAAALRVLTTSGLGLRIELMKELVGTDNVTPAVEAALEQRLEGRGGAIDPQHVLVSIKDFDSQEDPDMALAIEIAENEKRRDYTRNEVLALATRLRSLGYTDTAGRPSKGVKPIRPALATIVGKSQRTISRLLATKPEPGEGEPKADETQKALDSFTRSATRFLKATTGVRRKQIAEARRIAKELLEGADGE